MCESHRNRPDRTESLQRVSRPTSDSLAERLLGAAILDAARLHEQVQSLTALVCQRDAELLVAQECQAEAETALREMQCDARADRMPAGVSEPTLDLPSESGLRTREAFLRIAPRSS